MDLKELLKYFQDEHNLETNAEIDKNRKLKAKYMKRGTIGPAESEKPEPKSLLKNVNRFASVLGGLTPTGAAIMAMSPSEVADDDMEKIAEYKAKDGRLEALKKISKDAEEQMGSKLGKVVAPEDDTEDTDEDDWEAKREAYKKLVGRL